MIGRYKLHFIIDAPEFSRPRSFRTEAYARTFHDAREAAECYLMEQPVKDLRILAVSVEKVPEQ